MSTSNTWTLASPPTATGWVPSWRVFSQMTLRRWIVVVRSIGSGLEALQLRTAIRY
jgi:hypothetical protein